MNLENNLDKKLIFTLGPKNSYCDIVTKKSLKNININYCSNIFDIFKQVLKTKNSFAVVPFENMIGGNVRETMLCLKNRNFKIFSSFDLKIHHCFASKNNKFKKIISHPQTIAQCSDFLEKYKDKNYEIIVCQSNSKAAQIASNDEDFACICSKEAILENNNLNLILENVENNNKNVTRFLLILNNKNKYEEEFYVNFFKNHFKVLKKDDKINKTKQKTSLIIEPKEDKAGLLFEILAIFKIKNINLSKIESLPTQENLGEYLFFITVDSNLENENLKSAIKFLKTFVNLYLFGSYNQYEI